MDTVNIMTARLCLIVRHIAVLLETISKTQFNVIAIPTLAGRSNLAFLFKSEKIACRPAGRLRPPSYVGIHRNDNHLEMASRSQQRFRVVNACQSTRFFFF